MRRLVLQSLTWGTVAAAIASACWLAAVDLGRAERNALAVPDAAFKLAAEPMAAPAPTRHDESARRNATEPRRDAR